VRRPTDDSFDEHVRINVLRLLRVLCFHHLSLCFSIIVNFPAIDSFTTPQTTTKVSIDQQQRHSTFQVHSYQAAS
jgi:hypothetical protein